VEVANELNVAETLDDRVEIASELLVADTLDVADATELVDDEAPPLAPHRSTSATAGSWSLIWSAKATHVLICTCSYAGLLRAMRGLTYM
jgi:hypothetical protein